MEVASSDLELAPSDYDEGATSRCIHRVVDCSGHTKYRGLLFKEYREDVIQNADDFDSQGLCSMVRWLDSLSSQNREHAMAIGAFPLAVVHRQGLVVGFLMKEAAPAFLFHDSGRERSSRHITELGRRAESATIRRPYFEPPHKLAMLGHVLQQLQWIHLNGFVFGDLQPRNILITDSLSDRRAYFVDCDSFLLNGVSVVKTREPENWRVGDPSQGHSRATDLAKFALLTDRILTEQWNRPGRSDADLQRWMRAGDAELFERMWRQDSSLTGDELEKMISLFTKRLIRGTTMYIWPAQADSRVLWNPSSVAAVAQPGTVSIPVPRATRAAGTSTVRASRSPSTPPRASTPVTSAARRIPPRAWAVLVALVMVAIAVIVLLGQVP